MKQTSSSNPLRFDTLDDWLDWQTALHPREIELGLHRCRQVAERLAILNPPFPVITVAGTNGKGSSVALLDAILSTAGYRTGRYTSPHLLRYNERICIANQMVSDEQLCEAFNAIEEVREDISLTFFEFSTLAAMWIFQRQSIEVAILEVGLGGRLDAVNIFDASVALVTSISLDHMDFLGNDRESIGFEKAGIFRTQCPAVCSDANPPRRLLAYAEQLQTPLYCQYRDFNYHKVDATHWVWQCQHQQYTHLPWPQLPGTFQLQNAAGVLMALTLSPFSIPEAAIHQGLKRVHLAGRFQIIPNRIRCILDVAHNAAGVAVLSSTLQDYPCLGRRHAVVGILKDKDIAGMLSLIKPHIDHWHIAPLNAARSSHADDLSLGLTTLGVMSIHRYASIAAAYTSAMSQAQAGDDVIVFGSFYTIAEVLQQRAIA